MRRRHLAAAGLLVLGLAACGHDSSRDVEGVDFHDPDSIEGWNNVDGHPNIVKVCVDGLAFFTTTREAQAAIGRVPEWDQDCPGFRTR